MRKLRNGIANAYLYWVLLPQYRYLAQKKQIQYDRFLRVRASVAEYLNTLDRTDLDSRLVFDDWKHNAMNMHKTLSETIPFDFLQNEIVLDTMFVKAGGRWLREELAYLETHIERKRLAQLLEEELAGKPMLSQTPYCTSHNTVHTLYHLERFTQRTGLPLKHMQRVVEWGGGYGNMARIFHKHTESQHQYILIDHPVFACLQWLYLSCVLGPERVFLLTQKTDKIRERGISIVPLNLLEHVDLRADLFISTWALSESSKFALQTVVGKKWFGARHFLIAFDESFQATRHMRSLLQNDDVHTEPITFLPGNFYILK